MINKPQLCSVVVVLVAICEITAQSPSSSTTSTTPNTASTTTTPTTPTTTSTPTSGTLTSTSGVSNPTPNPAYPTPATSNDKDEINEEAQQLYAKLDELAQACQSLQYNCGGQGDTCDPLNILEQMEIQTVQNACEAITKNKASADAALQCNQSSISSGAGSSSGLTGTGTPTPTTTSTGSNPTTPTPNTS